MAIQNNSATASCQWNPIGHIFVRRCGESNPRVRADVDSSFPIVTNPVRRGTILYSNISIGLRQLKSRRRIASRIALYSSRIVGINRNITATGTEFFRHICSLSIAATNSLTVVVNIKRQNMDIPSSIFLNMQINPVKTRLNSRDTWGINNMGTVRRTI